MKKEDEKPVKIEKKHEINEKESSKGQSSNYWELTNNKLDFDKIILTPKDKDNILGIINYDKNTDDNIDAFANRNKERYCILKDKKVVKCDENTYTKWMLTKPDRRVAKDNIGRSTISTVFLCNSYNNNKPFETMVFDGVLNNESACYSTWDEAVKGHNKMIAKVKVAEKA